MGLSIASMRPISGISYTASTPMNYAVDNQADLSSAYVESAKSASATNGVMGAAPVVYPNAKTTEVNSVSQLDASREVGAAYNQIAGNYAGQTTSYTAASQGMSYGMVGSNIDVFA